MLILLLFAGLVIGAFASQVPLFGAAIGATAGYLLARQIELATELRAVRERLRGLESAGQAAAPTPQSTAATPATSTPPAKPPPDDAGASVRAQAGADASRRQPPASEAAPAAARPTPVFGASSASAARAAPPAHRPPDWQLRATAAVKRWFTEGNVPVKVGMLVLFFGVGALLKYAAEQGLFALPVELRLIAVALAACAGLWFGWRQRQARRVFALALQGGAIGVLLITVFAAFRIFDLLPAGAAFALLLVLVAGSALLALLQNAMALAVLGSVGGFLAPVLVSTGSGDHVALFSYYALLNAAIFAIAWLRPWRVLNLVGFGFTFAVGTLWGATYYQPQHYASVQPFLILFFLFYVAIAVLYALRQPEARRGLVDGSLLFGTPLLAFPLQAALLDGEPMALAYSALAVAALYALLAAWLIRRDGLRTLALSFAALAIGFATLAVPLALDASWTTATWALEGAALVWLGLRQQRRLPVVAGIALQGLAGLAYLWALFDAAWHGLPADALPLLNGPLLAGVLLAASALFVSYRLERSGSWPVFAWLGLIAGVGWWVLAGLFEVQRYQQAGTALLGWLAISLLLAALLRLRLPWPRLAWPLLLGFAASLLHALFVLEAGDAPLRALSALAWSAWLLAALIALHALRTPLARGVSFAHVGVLAVIAVVLGAEVRADLGMIAAPHSSWTFIGPMLPLVLLLWASWRRPQWLAFPLADLFDRYRLRWFVPASLALVAWWWLSLVQRGDPQPLPFLPLINPLELAQFGLLALLLGLWRDTGAAQWPWLRGALLLMAFVTISVATLRAVHQLGGVAWDPLLLHSMLAQSALTVVWSVLGVSAWIIGSRRGSRSVWLGGALLMAAVLVKLIVIDRGFLGDIAGVVSFLAVGLLLTVVGYFAPSPPRAVAREAT
jgi:uncharacterized membrane protein